MQAGWNQKNKKVHIPILPWCHLYVFRVNYLFLADKLHPVDINTQATHLHKQTQHRYKSTWAVINEDVTGWTSVCIHIGCVCVCVCVCVCFPATSIQQRWISGPDVCDLWSGRSCSGEASNVLNIISHRWRRVRTQQRSHTSGLPTPPFIPDHDAIFAKPVLVWLRTAPHPALTSLVAFFQHGSSSSGQPGGLVPYGSGIRPGRLGGECSEAIHVSHTLKLWPQSADELKKT